MLDINSWPKQSKSITLDFLGFWANSEKVIIKIGNRNSRYLNLLWKFFLHFFPNFDEFFISRFWFFHIAFQVLCEGKRKISKSIKKMALCNYAALRRKWPSGLVNFWKATEVRSKFNGRLSWWMTNQLVGRDVKLGAHAWMQHAK